MTDASLTIHLDCAPATAAERVRDALAEQGFGVLSEIDVQAAMKEKLDTDIGPYTILGACNPPLARQAIAADPDIGTLLPCNVLVRGDGDGGSDVIAADPQAMLQLSPNATALQDVASNARDRIQQALRDAAAR